MKKFQATRDENNGFHVLRDICNGLKLVKLSEVDHLWSDPESKGIIDWVWDKKFAEKVSWILRGDM
jgi:hypothetical protein